MSKYSNLRRKKKKKDYAKSKTMGTQRKEIDYFEDFSPPMPDFISDEDIVEFSDGLKEKAEIAQKLTERTKKRFGDRVVKGKNPLEKKASQIIFDFAKPMLEKVHSVEESKLGLVTSILAWNYVIISQDGYEEPLSELFVKAKMGIIEQTEFKNMISRKKTLFSDYKFIVADYDISETADGGVHLIVSAAQDSE